MPVITPGGRGGGSGGSDSTTDSKPQIIVAKNLTSTALTETTTAHGANGLWLLNNLQDAALPTTVTRIRNLTMGTVTRGGVALSMGNHDVGDEITTANLAAIRFQQGDLVRLQSATILALIGTGVGIPELGAATAATGSLSSTVSGEAYGVTAKAAGTAGNNIRIVVNTSVANNAQYMRVNGNDLEIGIDTDSDVFPNPGDTISTAADLVAAFNVHAGNTLVTFDVGNVGSAWAPVAGTYTFSGGTDGDLEFVSRVNSTTASQNPPVGDAHTGWVDGIQAADASNPFVWVSFRFKGGPWSAPFLNKGLDSLSGYLEITGQGAGAPSTDDYLSRFVYNVDDSTLYFLKGTGNSAAYTAVSSSGDSSSASVTFGSGDGEIATWAEGDDTSNIPSNKRVGVVGVKASVTANKVLLTAVAVGTSGNDIQLRVVQDTSVSGTTVTVGTTFGKRRITLTQATAIGANAVIAAINGNAAAAALVVASKVAGNNEGPPSGRNFNLTGGIDAKEGYASWAGVDDTSIIPSSKLPDSSGGDAATITFGSGDGNVAAWAEGDSSTVIPNNKLPNNLTTFGSSDGQVATWAEGDDTTNVPTNKLPSNLTTFGTASGQVASWAQGNDTNAIPKSKRADAWSAGIWAVGDIATHSNKLYVCLVARTASNTSNPGADSTGWKEIVAGTAGTATENPKGYWWGLSQTSRYHFPSNYFFFDGASTGGAANPDRVLQYKDNTADETYGSGTLGVTLLDSASVSSNTDAPTTEQNHTHFSVTAGRYNLKVRLQTSSRYETGDYFCAVFTVKSGTDDTLMFASGAYASGNDDYDPDRGWVFDMFERDVVFSATTQVYIRPDINSTGRGESHASFYVSWERVGDS